MPMSQSPDSVMAFSDGTSEIEAEDGTISATSACDGIGIGIGPSSLPTAQYSYPATSSSMYQLPLLSSASSSSQIQLNQAHRTVVNPYIKVTPTSTAVVDQHLRKRRQFIDKYRVQALQQFSNGERQNDAAQHSISCRGHVDPMVVVAPISAWNMYCATQQWRHSWQCPELVACKDNQLGIADEMPLKPRLFLIRCRNDSYHTGLKRQDQSFQNQQSQIERPTSSQPTQQHHHDEGIWELGNGITELSGEGGSGKTQICLSLCVTCVMMSPLYKICSESNQFATKRNHHYTALYISMGEGIQSINIARRVEQMVQCRLNKNYPSKQVKQILSRIGLISLRNEEEFIDFVDKDLPNILLNQNYHHQQQQQYYSHHHHHHQQQQQSKAISLIVFDGIAGFFRFSDPLFQQFQKSDSTFHRQRGSRLLHISSQLRRLSDLHDLPILITNQVTALIPSNDTSSLSATSPEDQVVPALGLAWSNCISTRFILQRRDEMITAAVSDEKCRNQSMPVVAKRNNNLMRVRVAQILQSVNMPKERKARFVIETGGVVAVADSH